MLYDPVHWRKPYRINGRVQTVRPKTAVTTVNNERMNRRMPRCHYCTFTHLRGAHSPRVHPLHHTHNAVLNANIQSTTVTDHHLTNILDNNSFTHVVHADYVHTWILYGNVEKGSLLEFHWTARPLLMYLWTHTVANVLQPIKQSRNAALNSHDCFCS